MATLIDSSVLIAAERGQLDLGDFFGRSSEEYFAISAITASELLHGVHRAGPDKRPTRETYVEHLFSRLPVIPFDLIAARIHAGLWATLAQKGIPVGSHDLLIASTAIAAGARVATRDERSFPKIPGVILFIP